MIVSGEVWSKGVGDKYIYQCTISSICDLNNQWKMLRCRNLRRLLYEKQILTKEKILWSKVLNSRELDQSTMYRVPNEFFSSFDALILSLVIFFNFHLRNFFMYTIDWL